MAKKYREVELTPEEAERYRASRGGMREVELSPGAPPPQVGPAETYVNRAVGNIPLGNLVTNLAATGALDAAARGGTPATLTPQARAELAAMGEDVPEEPGLVDRYRQVRDMRAERTEAGSQQNPWAGRLGAGTGFALSLAAPLPGVKVGAPRGIPSAAIADRVSKVLSGGATGAAYSGLNALTDGSADLTRGEVGEAAGEVARAVPTGALLGGAISAAAQQARPVAAWLREKTRGGAITQGRDVIQGGASIAGATHRATSDDAVEEVLKSGLMKSTTQKTYEAIDKAAEQSGDEYGRILRELEARGVEGPRAAEMAGAVAKASETARRNNMKGDPTARTLLKESRGLGEEARAADGLSSDLLAHLPLSRAEKLKRSAQKMGRFERVRNSPGEEAYQDIGGILRTGIERSIGEAGRRSGPGTDVGDLAARFQPVKERTDRLLQAREGAERGATLVANRPSMGIKDLVLGSAAGDPGSALATALVSSVARKRAASLAARGLYGASKGVTSTAGEAGRAAMALTPAEMEALATLLMDSSNRKRKDTK